MRQFGEIFKFEFKGYLKNKIFVGITVFLVVLIGVVMCLPRIMEAIGSDDPPEESEDKPVMLLTGVDQAMGEAIRATFEAAFPDYEIALREEADVRAEILAGEADCAFALEGIESFTYYVNDLTLYDANSAIATSALIELYRNQMLLASGITPEQLAQIMAFVPESETELLGQDQVQNYFYTYIMIMALYMVILLYGQMVSTSVASEKSSRAMELLITSAKPNAMMFGKVIAACLAGLSQLLAVFGSAFLFYNLNKQYFGDNEIVQSIFNIPASLLVYMLIFFVLGFLVYAFLFGAIGSTATKLEDINTSTMPLMFMFIIAFMVVMFSMSSGEVDNPLMIFCSFFPFTSPMAMFTRIAMSVVPIWQIILSILLLALSVVGVGVLSARIYRIGVLLYGTPPRIGAILKAIRKG